MELKVCDVAKNSWPNEKREFRTNKCPYRAKAAPRPPFEHLYEHVSSTCAFFFDLVRSTVLPNAKEREK